MTDQTTNYRCLCGADDPQHSYTKDCYSPPPQTIEPRWRVSPDDDRDIQRWDGSAWVFDCCTTTSADATKWVADNIAEEADAST